MTANDEQLELADSLVRLVASDAKSEAIIDAYERLSQRTATESYDATWLITFSVCFPESNERKATFTELANRVIQRERGSKLDLLSKIADGIVERVRKAVASTDFRPQFSDN